MAQFRWVNHNQAARREIDGQHLCSPKTESNGARSEYDYMRRATAAGLVISYTEQAIKYADQAISYIGRTAEFAVTTAKPIEFGETGAYRKQEGRPPPTIWTLLCPWIHPKTTIGSLGPLLPRRYSPIHAVSGSANQTAYPTGIPNNTFELVAAGATFSHDALSRSGSNSPAFEVINELGRHYRTSYSGRRSA
jgi:hypothetical protein